MQNGFDLLAIQDIIVEARPDLIIETGTAAGGSTILWASILELLELHHSRWAGGCTLGSGRHRRAGTAAARGPQPPAGPRQPGKGGTVRARAGVHSVCCLRVEL